LNKKDPEPQPLKEDLELKSVELTSLDLETTLNLNKESNIEQLSHINGNTKNLKAIAGEVLKMREIENKSKPELTPNNEEHQPTKSILQSKINT
jgi:hypothetical protein